MKRIEGQNHARFLTFSCYRRMDLLGSEALRDEFACSLERAREKHTFLLHAYVVMPNHVHLLLRPERNSPGVTPILYSLKQSFAQRVIKRWRDVDAPVLSRIVTPRGPLRFWQQGGGYDRNIYSDDEMREKIEYIHANPVRVELVAKPTDWTWSSARWWADRCEDAIPMDRIDL